MEAERKAVKEWLKTVDREELDAMLQAAIFTPDELKYIRMRLIEGMTFKEIAIDQSLTRKSSVPTPSIENNSKTIANTEFVHGVVSDLVNGAPTALDTLQELATALGNDPNFSTTILNKIGEKESKTDAQIEHKRLQDAIPTDYVQSVTELNGKVTVTKGSGESTTFNAGLLVVDSDGDIVLKR